MFKKALFATVFAVCVILLPVLAFASTITYDKGRDCIRVSKKLAEYIEKETDFDDITTYIFAYKGKKRQTITEYKLNNSIERITLDEENCQIIVKTVDISAFMVKEDGNYYYIHSVPPREKYSKIIVIDAGHGGVDSGTEYAGIIEKSVTFKVGAALYNLFLQSDTGIKAYMTRYGDESVHRYRRAALSNALGDLFVSIHADSSPDEPSMRGVHTYFSTRSSTELSRFPIDPEKFAEVATDEMARAMHTVNGNFENDVELSVLIRAKVPAILTEIGYATNIYDRVLLDDPQYLQNAAQGLFNAIVKIFDGYYY